MSIGSGPLTKVQQRISIIGDAQTHKPNKQ
jgi:hypothetical protein